MADELVELRGRLPLAIRVAAARLRAHPAWDLTHLAARLRDQQQRLVELAAGQRSVTAALDLSYHDLEADQQQAYRRLGLHFGPDIDAHAAAALLDTTAHQASRLLEQLLEAHLLQEPTPGRYRFHDLTRAHAAHRATHDQPDWDAAVDRLLDYYRHSAAVAMHTAYPYDRGHRPQVPPVCSSPVLSEPAPALDWLDSELPNLLAAARYASEQDRPAHVVQLSSILHRHLRTHGHYYDADNLHQQALATARAAGHQAAELEALTSLGHIHRMQGRYEQGSVHYQQALQLALATGRPAAEPEALTGLAHIHRMQGRYEQATDHYRQGVRLAQATGNQAAELEAVSGLGHIHRMQGRYEQATNLWGATSASGS